MNIKTTVKLVLLVLAVYCVLWGAYHWSKDWRSRLTVSEALTDLEDGFFQSTENDDRNAKAIDQYRFWKVFLSRLRRASAAGITSSWLQFAASEPRELAKWQSCRKPTRTDDELLSCDAQFDAMLASSPPSTGPQVRRAFRSTNSVSVKLPLQIEALLTPLTHLSSSRVPPQLPLVLWHLDVLLDLRLFMHTVGRRLTFADHPQLLENVALDESFDGSSVLALISAVPPYKPASHSMPSNARSSKAPQEAHSSISSKLQVLAYLLSGTVFFDAVQDPSVLAHFALEPEHLPLARSFALREEATPSFVDRFYDTAVDIDRAFRRIATCQLPLNIIRRLQLLHHSHPSLSLGAFLTESLRFDPTSPTASLGRRFFAEINERATFILNYANTCDVGP